MALPPERLEELLPHASRGVLVEVLGEVRRGSESPDVERPPGWTGPISDDPWQLLRIKVREVLFGPAEPRVLTVFKPKKPYLLFPGDLWDSDRVMLLSRRRLLTRYPIIMGLYGPKMYSRDDVLARLDTRRK